MEIQVVDSGLIRLCFFLGERLRVKMGEMAVVEGEIWYFLCAWILLPLFIVTAAFMMI